MPTTIFDWIVRTAMLVMAGLVTLSILGAIATMTNDPGTSAAPGDRPLIEVEPARERESEQAPRDLGEGNATAAAGGPDLSGGSTIGPAAAPARDEEVARWLEAIAYALLALAGIGALVVLMLASVVRELRRRGS